MSLVWNRLPAGHAFAIAVLEAHDEAGHIVSLLLVEVPGIPVDLRDPKGRLLVGAGGAQAEDPRKRVDPENTHYCPSDPDSTLRNALILGTPLFGPLILAAPPSAELILLAPPGAA